MDKSLLVKILGFPATLIHGDTLVLDRWIWLKNKLPLTFNGETLIDIGCGTGSFTIGAALRGYKSIGLSWDERNQTVAEQRKSICNATLASFDILDVRKLNTREDLLEKFDIAICFENIEHILDDSKLMADIADCLKPGGRLLLTTPYYHYRAITSEDNGLFSKEETGWHVRRGYTQTMLIELLNQHDLIHESTSYVSGFLSQKITFLFRIFSKINFLLAWILVFPLRIFPPIFDRIIANFIEWPYYSICIEAYKPKLNIHSKVNDEIMSEKSQDWICCQIGAREHYAIPRALEKFGQLAHLITDAWVPPQSWFNLLPKDLLTNFRERFHPDLSAASIHAFNSSLISLEIAHSISKKSGWERIIVRNCWFQERALRCLKFLDFPPNASPILFAYSYAAVDLFRYAKNRGWRTILGQIDPGLVEEKLVFEEQARHPQYLSNWQPAPTQYWDSWQEECSLADRIMVNSVWSSQALQQIGISVDKIDIIPLAYQSPKEAGGFVRTYPVTFSNERPLRVLFLGQVILRKGIVALLEATKLLSTQPIEFWLVGSQGIDIPPETKAHKQVKWVGAVARSSTAMYYQLADIFLFPTLSDGFGLTQLEAQAWKLPVIASRFCGKVVQDGVNGLILAEVTGEAIAQTLRFCLHNPEQLASFSQNSIQLSQYNLSKLQYQLEKLSYY